MYFDFRNLFELCGWIDLERHMTHDENRAKIIMNAI